MGKSGVWGLKCGVCRASSFREIIADMGYLAGETNGIFCSVIQNERRGKAANFVGGHKP
jgi:hypothetical protein